MNYDIQKIPCTLHTFSSIDEKSNLLKVRLRIVNVGSNPNKSSFSKEAIQRAEGTLCNIPILGYIKYDDNGNAVDFDAHNIITTLVSNEDGFSIEEKYLEQPIGVIPETNNLTYEIYNGKEYLCCDGYVWKSYANEGYDLIMSSDEKSVSMEIKVLNGDKDSKTNLFNIEDFEFLGITVLGDDVLPGIENANLKKYFNMSNYKLAIQEICEEIFAMKGVEVLDKEKELVELVESEEIVEEVEAVVEEVVDVIEEVIEEVVEEEAISETIEEVEASETIEEEPELKDEEPELVEEFSLSVFGTMEQVECILQDRTVKYTDRWGDAYDVNEFWFVDLLTDEKKVIVNECSSNRYFGISYEIHGDTVAMDFENKIEYVCKWCEKTGQQEEPEFKVANSIEFAMNLKDSKIEALTTELEGLRAFKKTIDDAKYEIEIEEIISEFSLNVEDTNALKERAITHEISKEEFKKELYVLQGMKVVEELRVKNFSKKETKKDDMTRVIPQEEKSESVYGDLDKYLKK